MKRVSFIGLTFLVLFGSAIDSWATYTYTCTGSNDQDGINTAITNAAAGITVTVAPTPACNFTGRVNLAKSGGIKLVFNGTSITGALSGGSFFRLLTYSGNDDYRLSGFVMNGTTEAGSFIIEVDGPMNSLIIDSITDNSQNKFISFGLLSGMWSYVYEGGAAPGQKFLIHSITKHNGQFLRGNGRGYLAWAEDDAWGTEDFIIVENCKLSYDSFPQGGMIDGENGTKFVFRYNDVTNGWFVYHDMGGPRYRGSRAFEVYNNKFTCNDTSCSSYYPAIHWRGGTGLVYNNSATAALKPFIGYEIFRKEYENWFGPKCQDSGTLTFCRDAWWHCQGGTRDGLLCYGNDADCTGGGVCRQTGCTSNSQCKDYFGNIDLCFVLDGGGTGNYPCRDQNGRGKDDLATGTQALQPAYFWENYFNGILTGFYDVSPYIISDRDYCNHAPSTGCGLKAAWTYTPRACPDIRAGFSGTCDSTKYGTQGYPSEDNSDTTPPAVPTGLTIR